MFNVYDCHKLSQGNRIIKLLPVDTLSDVLELARLDAREGFDAFLRAYEIVDDGPTGERFAMAFSVLNGKVFAHPAVTIPAEHW